MSTKKDGEFTTVYFDCTQREDCQFSRIKREVRPAIERYPGKGGIIMKIDLPQKSRLVINAVTQSQPMET